MKKTIHYLIIALVISVILCGCGSNAGVRPDGTEMPMVTSPAVPSVSPDNPSSSPAMPSASPNTSGNVQDNDGIITDNDTNNNIGDDTGKLTSPLPTTKAK